MPHFLWRSLGGGTPQCSIDYNHYMRKDTKVPVLIAHEITDEEANLGLAQLANKYPAPEHRVTHKEPLTKINGTPAMPSGRPAHTPEQARNQGFEGDACRDCGNFTLVRSGTCLKCVTCGATTGCS